MKHSAKGLTGNQLKLLAMLAMTLDHIGYILLPQVRLLRIAGRLAFPVFAYMIAEGCRYTRSMGKYLGNLLITAVLCQLVTFAAGSLYMNIMVTFSVSVALVWLARTAREKGRLWRKLACGAAVVAAFVVAELLPFALPNTDFGIDYGFPGIILPVLLYFCKNKTQKLCVTALVMVLLSGFVWDVQWYSLLSLPLLALYNGQRGKWKLKWLFYAYYPAHLAVLWGIAFLLW